MSTINLYNNKLKNAYYGIKKKNRIDVKDIVEIYVKKNNIFVVNNQVFNCDPCIDQIKFLYIITELRKYKIKENHICCFIYEKNIINIHNIDELNLFSNINLVRIFGKGPTFKNIRKRNDNELHFGINQTANFLDDIDVLVINDLHNIYKIDKNVFKKLSYVLIPEFLHINKTFNEKGNWIQVYHHIKDVFKGYYIIFNLFSNINSNPHLITINIGTSSVNTATQFVCDYFKNLKKIEFYGTGVKSTLNYNNHFVGNGDYINSNFIDRIVRDIKKSCKDISYTLN